MSINNLIGKKVLKKSNYENFLQYCSNIKKNIKIFLHNMPEEKKNYILSKFLKHVRYIYKDLSYTITDSSILICNDSNELDYELEIINNELRMYERTVDNNEVTVTVINSLDKSFFEKVIQTPMGYYIKQEDIYVRDKDKIVLLEEKSENYDTRKKDYKVTSIKSLLSDGSYILKTTKQNNHGRFTEYFNNEEKTNEIIYAMLKNCGLYEPQISIDTLKHYISSNISINCNLFNTYVIDMLKKYTLPKDVIENIIKTIYLIFTEDFNSNIYFDKYDDGSWVEFVNKKYKFKLIDLYNTLTISFKDTYGKELEYIECDNIDAFTNVIVHKRMHGINITRKYYKNHLIRYTQTEEGNFIRYYIDFNDSNDALVIQDDFKINRRSYYFVPNMRMGCDRINSSSMATLFNLNDYEKTELTFDEYNEIYYNKSGKARKLFNFI